MQKPLLLIDGDAEFASFVRTEVSMMHNSGLVLRWEKTFDAPRLTPSTISTFALIFVGEEAGGRAGMDIIAEIRTGNPDIPIIFLSHEKDFETIRQAIRFDADDFLLKKEIHGTYLIDHVHRVLQRVMMRKNITDLSRKTLLEQKKKEAIEELIVTVCHEFNNPLAAIKISADILSRQTHPPHLSTALEQLTRNVHIVETLVNRLRDQKRTE
jgi:DNA-binding NtrC family response regulator